MVYLRHFSEFEYVGPETINEVCCLLESKTNGAEVIAGGTDILVCMKQGKKSPQTLIGLNSVRDLYRFEYSEQQGLCFGAMLTHNTIASNPIVRERFNSLCVACSSIGTPQIRNMGTIGGNLCNAAPSADSAPPLIALEAKVKLVSSRGERTVYVEDFFTGPGETVLELGEILSEIQIPALKSNTGTAYVKLPARTAVDIAAVSVSALIILDSKKEECVCARIVLGAVASTPVRAKRAEDVLQNRALEHSVIREAARLASEEASPISDVRSSAEYRMEMVKVVTRTAILVALERAKNANLRGIQTKEYLA